MKNSALIGCISAMGCLLSAFLPVNSESYAAAHKFRRPEGLNDPNAKVALKFSSFTCDKTRENGADEVYFIIIGKSSRGRTYFWRAPDYAYHWDMNDGDQGVQPASGYGGDARTITDSELFRDNDMMDGETWNIAVLIMEEDGGTSKKYQELASRVLSQVDDPYAQAAGGIIATLTRLGLWISDTDDYIGSFGIRFTRNGDGHNTNWTSGDRVIDVQYHPGFVGNANARAFRWNGDGSNYSGGFLLTR